MNTKKWSRLLGPVVLSVMLLAVAIALGPMAMQATPAAAQGPLPGTVQGVGTYTLFPTTLISDDVGAVTYTNAPYNYKGLDMALARNWNSADAFITVAGMVSTDAVTVTAQLSPDESNWVDAYRLSEGWVLPLDYAQTMTGTGSVDSVTALTNTAVGTDTTTLTGTTTVASTSTSTGTTTIAGTTATRASEEVPIRLIPTADGTYYVSFPVAGMYVRYKIEYSGALTLTIKNTYRNN